jgi:hypothetical protein
MRIQQYTNANRNDYETVNIYLKFEEEYHSLYAEC